MTQRPAAAGRGSETWKVRGASHFYPASSEAVRDDGRRATVEEAIAAFLGVIARLKA